MEEKWIGNLNRQVYLHYWMVATFTQILTEVPLFKKKLSIKDEDKSKLEIELKSNFTFKWFANVDVKFGMNVANDHSWESYTPADH